MDDNPFRYCGEYYDKETKTIYLRARYYNVEQGRFTQEDTHWTVSNMIYGDDPNNSIPDISAIIQSGNLYVYCGNNPIMFKDITGDAKTFSFGCEYDLGNHWYARFDQAKVGNNNHIHVYNKNTKEEWVMNLDGSMSHENKSEKGDPPKKVLKKLKEKTQFDYKEVRQDFMKNDDISIGGGMFRTCTIYTDGTVEVGNVCYYNLDPNELSMELQVKDAKFSSFFSGWIFENWFLPFNLPFVSPIPLPAGTVF